MSVCSPLRLQPGASHPIGQQPFQRTFSVSSSPSAKKVPTLEKAGLSTNRKFPENKRRPLSSVLLQAHKAIFAEEKRCNFDLCPIDYQAAVIKILPWQPHSRLRTMSVHSLEQNLRNTVKEKLQKRKVISVGPGKVGGDSERIPPDVKAGNRILFCKDAGTEINIDGVAHLFMGKDNVLGIPEQVEEIK